MLITCPECKNQISDKAIVCIHCGYPLQNIKENICNINGIDYDFSDVFSNMNDNNKTPASCIRYISDKCSIPIYEAKEIYSTIINNNELPSNIKCDNKPQSNAPKCPTCSSTNIQKIGTGERAVSVAMLGMFSKKINKSFKCKNCGYTW